MALQWADIERLHEEKRRELEERVQVVGPCRYEEDQCVTGAAAVKSGNDTTEGQK